MAQRQAAELLHVAVGKRAQPSLQPPQSSAVYSISPSSSPAECQWDNVPVQLSPATAGGCFAECPLCHAAFTNATSQFDCNVILGTLLASQLTFTKRELQYSPCTTTACPGRNYVDGHLLNICILSARPPPGGARGQQRTAYGFDVSTAAFLANDALRGSVFESWQTYFHGADTYTRQVFNFLLQRFRLYMMPPPSLAPAASVQVIDGCRTQASAMPQCISGTTSVPPVHVCSPAPPGAAVNANPVHGMMAAELPYLGTGLTELGASGMTVDWARLLLHRLGLSAAQGREGGLKQTSMGWGSISLNVSERPLSPNVTVGEVADAHHRLSMWSTAIQGLVPWDAAAEYTPSALALARSFHAILPLLSSLIPEGAAAEEVVVVPTHFDAMLLSLQSKYPLSAVARLPFIGAHFFPALVEHVQRGGSLCAPVPESILTPAAGEGTLPGLRQYLQTSAKPPTGPISFAQTLHFLSPELYKACSAGQAVSYATAAAPPALLPIFTRYGELASAVARRSLRILLPLPVAGTLAPLFKPFGYTSLTSWLDTLWQYSERVEVLLHSLAHGEEAQAIIAALRFEDREVGSVATRNSDAQRKLHMMGFPLQRAGRVHYLDAHPSQESSDCASCHSPCTSKHCETAAKEDSIPSGGCSHQFDAKLGFTGGTVGALRV